MYQFKLNKMNCFFYVYSFQFIVKFFFNNLLFQILYPIADFERLNPEIFSRVKIDVDNFKVIKQKKNAQETLGN